MAARKERKTKTIVPEEMEDEAEAYLATLRLAEAKGHGSAEAKAPTPPPLPGFPLVLRNNGATKAFDYNKIIFGPAEPWGSHDNTWHIPALHGKDGIRLRTPFLHTGFGLQSKAFVNKSTGREGLPKDTIPLELAGKDKDPMGLPNKVEEFKTLMCDFDRWTVSKAIEGKWLGDDVALMTYHQSYKPIHTENRPYPDQMKLTCPSVAGRSQLGVYEWDTKKQVEPTRLEYDSLISVEFEMPYIKISQAGGNLTWGWQTNAMDVLLSPNKYEEDYRTKRVEFKCPWA